MFTPCLRRTAVEPNHHAPVPPGFCRLGCHFLGDGQRLVRIIHVSGVGVEQIMQRSLVDLNLGWTSQLNITLENTENTVTQYQRLSLINSH